MIIRWVLELLLFLMVVRLLWRFAAGVMDGMNPPPPPRKAKKAVGLVRDPVCGMHVVPNPALSMRAGKETQFFCSERCRDEYARRGEDRRLREAK